jgi:hypothetical protein
MNPLTRKLATLLVRPVYLADHSGCTRILGPPRAENTLIRGAQTAIRRCTGIYRIRFLGVETGDSREMIKPEESYKILGLQTRIAWPRALQQTPLSVRGNAESPPEMFAVQRLRVCRDSRRSRDPNESSKSCKRGRDAVTPRNQTNAGSKCGTRLSKRGLSP